MFGIFRIGSPVERIVSTIADCMLLGVLWLLCSIPLFTVGAATKALYYASMRSVRKEGNVWKDFFRSFREDFASSICVTALYFVVVSLVGTDFWILSHIHLAGAGFFKTLLYVLCLLIALITVYFFPLLARYKAPIKHHLKNALMLSFASPVTTLLLLILNYLPIALLLWDIQWFFRLLPFVLLLWIGCAAHCSSRLLLRMFDQIQSKKHKMDI